MTSWRRTLRANPVATTLGVVAVGALVLRALRTGPRLALVRSAGPVTPVGPEYVAEKMPHYDAAQRCDFVRMLRRELAAILPPAAVDLFAAHVGRETGFGRSVYCFNFGNIRAFAATDAPWCRLPNGYPFRAYMSEADGLRAAVDLIARRGGRYAGAYAKLLAGDATWYATLGLAGYYEVDGRAMVASDVPRQQADYQRSLNGVRACP